MHSNKVKKRPCQEGLEKVEMSRSARNCHSNRLFAGGTRVLNHDCQDPRCYLAAKGTSIHQAESLAMQVGIVNAKRIAPLEAITEIGK